MILNVEFEFELEVPDHVKLVAVNEDIGEMLFIHGKLLEPELDWRALSKISDDGGLEFEIISERALNFHIFDSDSFSCPFLLKNSGHV